MIDVSRIDAIVVGGSAGAFTALKVLVPALPAALHVPVLIVVHVPEDRPSAVAQLFSHETRLRVKEADDKERLEPGTVYFAPPGYHLLVEWDRSAALDAGEPRHFSRPSIDVLFESAADVFGSRLLAVILSGASADGAAGLKAVGLRGGITIVQQPATAEHPLMPNAAIAAHPPTAILPLDEVARLFGTLGAGLASGDTSRSGARHA